MQELLKNIFAGIVRHSATAAGGYLVSQGLITGNQENDFIGSVIFLAGVAWSAYQKYSARPKPSAK